MCYQDLKSVRRKLVFKTIDYKSLEGDYVLIDVRSPGEYNEATIPGAINIPLFTDEERKQIGIVYVNESVEKAKQLGVEAVANKLPIIFREISQLDRQYGKLIFFCARGGMRSGSISSLMISLGINAFKLSGGYKAYRKIINEELPKLNKGVKYIVLRGKTGTGKTEILNCLKNKGYDVLDLESAANHRGSLLGNVGLGEGKSQKYFETRIYEMLRYRKSNYVFVEGESKRIGNVIIPGFIFDSMSDGIHVFIDADLDFRSKLIIREYTKENNCKEEIYLCLDKLSKYISEKNIGRYKALVSEEKYEEVTGELMEKYYDPMYMNAINKYKFDAEFKIQDIETSCREIEAWAKDIIFGSSEAAVD
jgi:tRNA 2-selenouridine synthase